MTIIQDSNDFRLFRCLRVAISFLIWLMPFMHSMTMQTNCTAVSLLIKNHVSELQGGFVWLFLVLFFNQIQQKQPVVVSFFFFFYNVSNFMHLPSDEDFKYLLFSREIHLCLIGNTILRPNHLPGLEQSDCQLGMIQDKGT